MDSVSKEDADASEDYADCDELALTRLDDVVILRKIDQVQLMVRLIPHHRPDLLHLNRSKRVSRLPLLESARSIVSPRDPPPYQAFVRN